MIVVNLWGEPGAGKSTVAFGLLFLLKINRFKAELVAEVAKEHTYDKRTDVFGDQTSIFAEQNRRQRRLALNNLDYAVSDSPLPLPIIYKPPGYTAEFDALVMAKFASYTNINYLLHRTHHPFEEDYRVHTEQEAQVKAVEIRQFLDVQGIPYTSLDANEETPAVILRDLLARSAHPPILTMPSGFSGRP
jgi:dephospho-CoA kinase